MYNHIEKSVQILYFFCIFQFFHTYTEYRDLKSKFLYPVQVRKDVDNKIWSKFEYFSGPFFPLLRLCTEICGVNIYI